MRQVLDGDICAAFVDERHTQPHLCMRARFTPRSDVPYVALAVEIHSRRKRGTGVFVLRPTSEITGRHLNARNRPFQKDRLCNSDLVRGPKKCVARQPTHPALRLQCS